MTSPSHSQQSQFLSYPSCLIPAVRPEFPNRNRYLLYRKMVELYKAFRFHMGGTLLSGSGDEDLRTFDDLQFELESIYGPMDVEDARFAMYLEEFKRHRLELMTSTRELVEFLSQGTPDKPAEQILFEREGALLSMIKNTFTVAEIDMFDLNPFTNSDTKDYFILPRKPLSYENIIHQTNASALSKEDISDEIKESYRIGVRKFNGLGFFDPKFHGIRTENVPIQFGANMATTFRKFLQTYPYGATPSVLEARYEAFFGYDIQFEKMGVGATFFRLMTAMSDVCWTVESSDLPPPMRLLVFPRCLRGSICSVSTLLYRIWHNFLCMTAAVGTPTPLDGSWEMLTKFMGLDKDELHLSSWGFPSTEAFVRYCLDRFDATTRKIHFVVRTRKDDDDDDKDGSDSSKLFVFNGLKTEVPEGFERFGEAEEEELEAKATPSTSVGNAVHPTQVLLTISDLKEWATDSIKPGDTISCRQGFSTRPTMFSFVRDDMMVLCVAFRERMTARYERIVANSLDFIKINAPIGPGSLVAVHFQDEWRRALVLRRRDNSKFRIYLLEGGGFADVPSSRFAVLLPEFLSVPAMGILCRLELGTHGIQNERQRKFRLEILPDITSGKRFKVTFLSSEMLLGHPFWTVRINTLVRCGTAAPSLRWGHDMHLTLRDLCRATKMDKGFKEDRPVLNHGDNGQRIKRAVKVKEDRQLVVQPLKPTPESWD